MSIHPESRIPLTLLGGFLGSGKTTWLRHQLHAGEMAQSLVIVNEAADVPVDDMLLSRSSEIRLLAGGCACCDGKDRLIALLREVCDERVDENFTGAQHTHLVLETSGLADPGPIVDAIRTDPVLMHHILVHEIVVVVDALHGIAYLKSEPLGRSQVETADQLIITKADAVDDAALRQLSATLNVINPGAQLSATVMGSEVALPESGDADAVHLPAFNSSGSNTNPVISTSIRLADGTDWTAFGLWLSALLHARGDDVVRVKGVMRTPSGRLLLQSVRKIVQSPEILPDSVTARKDENCIVFIGKGFKRRDLQMSLKRFAGLHSEDADIQDQREAT